MSSDVDKLSEEIRDVALLVHTAQERSEDRQIVTDAHLAVDRLSQRYREVCGRLAEGERMTVERKLGRRVTDLRRMASLLPRIGAIATGALGDRQGTGPSEVGERRITGVSWHSDDRRREAPSTAVRVGGEVDAWCGPCEALTTHHVIAMVGDTPKQVVCQACNNRHGYRTSPARKSAVAEEVAHSAPQESDAVRKAEDKAEELRALGREVASAEHVRVFDPRERYRTGDIISHAEFGRGKVETVLRSSLLVRFASGGLKSLMLT